MGTIDHVRHHHARLGKEQGLFTASPVGEGGFQATSTLSEREHIAKRVIQIEHDRLVQGGNLKLDREVESVGELRKAHARVFMYTIGMTCFAMVPYAILIAMWFLVYHNSLSQTVGIAILFLVLSVGCMIGSYRRVLRKDRPHL